MRTIAMNELELVEHDEQFEEAMQATLTRMSGGFPQSSRRRDVMPSRMIARLIETADLEEAQLPRAKVLTFGEIGRAPRSAVSFWTAIGAHAAAILIIGFFFAHAVKKVSAPPVVISWLVAPPPPMPPALPKLERMGGGGGQHDVAPATVGHLPKFAEPQMVPPKTPPVNEAKLLVEPTVVMQKDLKLADNSMPNLGLPNSSLRGVSLGNGSGTGLGSGNGAGIGVGSGGNMGGGIMHIGGSVHAPVVLYQVDPEFSEEARKAKFSGNVEVYLWVDENGKPSHIRVARGVGMGLDEKALAAVAQYKFKPALQNGKPVKVDLYIDVQFQIF